MTEFVNAILKNDNKNRIYPARLFVLSFIFFLTNQYFDITQKIKTSINEAFYNRILEVVKIAFEFICIGAVALFLCFIASVIIFSVVDKLSSGKFYKFFYGIVRPLGRSSLDFASWGAVLIAIEYSFERNYILEFFADKSNWLTFTFFIICIIATIEMLYDLYSFNAHITIKLDENIKIENAKDPLRVEIVSKTDKVKSIKTRE